MKTSGYPLIEQPAKLYAGDVVLSTAGRNGMMQGRNDRRGPASSVLAAH